MTKKQMKVGVLLPTRNVVTNQAPGQNTMAALINSAVSLEAMGYDSVWVGDSLLGRPRPEPLAVLAALAARTTKIDIGTSALLPAMRHPLQLAQMAATVDVVSNGRLILGVGSGFPNDQTKRELEAMEIDYPSRTKRCHEVVAWCKSLWGGDHPRATYQWQFDSDIRVDPRPVQTGGPAFWLGGASDSACQRVGQDYDGWMPTSPDPETFARGWEIIQASAEKQGRPADAITACTVLTLSPDEDDRAAEDNLRKFIETYYSAPLEAARTIVGCASGTLASLREQISKFETAGVEHLIIRFASADQEAAIQKWAAPLHEALSEN